MRIISGKFKGRRINAPKDLPARPTKDFAKEALFNIINNQYNFNELVVLDLFAGIGSISFEFASRGTPNIISVDQHYRSIVFIEKITKEFEFPIQTIKSDVFKFLEKTNQKFDIIFADPPYEFGKDQFCKIVDLVFLNHLLNDRGKLIIEHSKRTDLSDLTFFSYARKYGNSMFSFFEKIDD